MPNHCDNDLYIYGPDLGYVRDFVKGEKEVFDANRIIPMPEILRDSESSSTAEEGLIVLGRADNDRVEMTLNFSWVQEAGVTDLAGLQAFLREKNPGCVEAGERAVKALDETGYHDWYAWAIDNWGTKWGTYASTIVEEPDHPKRLRYRFSSAWSPPTPVIEALAVKFPKNTFSHRYYECGVGYKGHKKYKKGKLVEESNGSYRGGRGG